MQEARHCPHKNKRNYAGVREPCTARLPKLGALTCNTLYAPNGRNAYGGGAVASCTGNAYSSRTGISLGVAKGANDVGMSAVSGELQRCLVVVSGVDVCAGRAEYTYGVRAPALYSGT